MNTVLILQDGISISVVNYLFTWNILDKNRKFLGNSADEGQKSGVGASSCLAINYFWFVN